MDAIEKMMSQYGISKFPSDTSYAMAYVPFQQYSPKLYSPMQGYECGTIFESLNKPFCPKDCEGLK